MARLLWICLIVQALKLSSIFLHTSPASDPLLLNIMPKVRVVSTSSTVRCEYNSVVPLEEAGLIIDKLFHIPLDTWQQFVQSVTI